MRPQSGDQRDQHIKERRDQGVAESPSAHRRVRVLVHTLSLPFFPASFERQRRDLLHNRLATRCPHCARDSHSPRREVKSPSAAKLTYLAIFLLELAPGAVLA